METIMDFGAWVETVLIRSDLNLQSLSAESTLLYAYLSRLINSGKKGKAIRPDQSTVIQIGEALVRLGVIEDKGEAEIEAGYIPAGYKIVREDKAQTPETDTVPIEYEPILDELRSASYDGGGLDTGDVDEITEIIRMKARRRAERQGRA